MHQSQEIAEISKALAVAQGAMKAAIFNRINPHFKNKYADLAAIWDAIREPLSKNGLSITQTMQMMGISGNSDLSSVLITTLRHSSGQWIASFQPLPTTQRPQEFGSALTYARRYSLSAIIGIAAEEDDDANTAQKTKPSAVGRLEAGIERENRHGTTPADVVEHETEYDTDGHPIDSIPRGDDGVERMSKAMARPEYANLQADIRNSKTLADLEKWGGKNRNRVESLPLDWQEMLRGEYRTRQIELGWKPKELVS